MENKVKELEEKLLRKKQECERLKYNNDYEVGALEKTIDNLKAELEQEQTLKKMYFTYYKAKHSDIKGEFFKLKAENETYKKMLEDENVRLALIEIRTGERKLWFDKAEKYKQALSEIKEIALGVRNYLDCPSPKDVRYEMDIILRLISEVEK